MRSTGIRTVIGATAALMVVGASMAHAAAPKAPAAPVAVTITDPAGDANAINDQSTGAPVPSTATPTQVAAADIISISWKTLVTTQKVGKKIVNVPTAMQVKMTLSGAPQLNTIYRVTTATGDCTTFWLNYSQLADGAAAAALQHNCPGFTASSATSSTESVSLDTFKLDANSITWTIPAKLLPKAIKVGTQVTALSGHTRFYAGTSKTGGATVPAIDMADGGSAVYTYGK
jgi:hypothetical protein